MTFLELTPDRLESAANMLKAIAHPIRIAIVGLLEGDKRLTVTQIHEQLGIEQPAASHHLGVLKDKGLLLSKREGNNTYYSLKFCDLSKIVDCISRCNND